MQFSYQLASHDSRTILPFIQCNIKLHDINGMENGKLDDVKNDIILIFGIADEYNSDMAAISVSIIYEADTKKFKMKLYEI